MDTSSLESEG
jgi:hypothetical protein